MSNYDVAFVVDAGTLNTGMTQLYANPTAQATLFKGLETIGKLGVVSVDWAIGAAPQFVLAPPDSTQWNDPNTFSPSGKPKPATPSDQMFQVKLPSLTTTINLEQGPPLPFTFEMVVFAQVSIAGDHIALSSVAVQPLNVGGVQELYLQVVCGIVYEKVTDLLAGYQIPSSINVAGQTFTPPAMTISAGYLAVASNLTSSKPLDISGVVWPQQALGILLGRNVLNALLNQYSTAIVQKMDSASVNHSDSNWAGSYALSGGISSASIALASTLPDINVSATFSATASVGVSWWLVPGACALEAASNLL
ncbi:hypothetical protein [Pseudoduganella sp. HUAS MS19]